MISVGIAMLETNITSDVSSMTVFDSSVIINFVILGLLLIMTFAIAVVMAYGTSHYIIRPLRQLNQKMRDIMSAGIDRDLEEEEESSSKELSKLYQVFNSLISNKKFENNDFMTKPDVLAVLDLAEACNMFDGSNYKAAGVCFNNIANIQYNNEKYILASENYFNAMDQAMIVLGLKTAESVYRQGQRQR